MSFEKLFSKIAALFKKLKLPHMLVGGLAVAYWGYPRQSLDIDIVVDLKKEQIDKFCRAAQTLGFLVNRAEVDSMVKLGNRFVMEAADFRIDCWLPRTRFEKQALAGRKKVRVFGVDLAIISPEELVLAKLLAGRARDYEDAKTVLLRQGKKIKKDRLKQQAGLLGLLPELNKLIKEK